MILRKPYAFLIKNFKLIHGLLTLMFSFIMYQTNNIYTFFKQHLEISRNLKYVIEPYITSIPWYLYFIIILALGILSIIFILMNRKKKPVKYYIYALIFYFVAMLAFLFSAAQISALVIGNASLTLVSAARDIMQMVYWGQYVFLFISILRTIGFNFKKFNFESDLKDLDILEEDNEEFEFEVGLDSDDVKTKIRRNFRMIKYFLLENKIVLLPIFIILIVVVVVSIFLNVKVYNKIYKENESFAFQNLNMKILDTYETINDYTGKDISKGKYIYYITKVEVKNVTSEAKIINLDNIRLMAGDNNYYDIAVKENGNFFDLGNGYSSQRIEAGASNEYIFVFKVDKENKKKAKILHFLKGYNEEGLVYTKVKLKPQNADQIDIKNNANLKANLDINNKFAGKITLNIEEYYIAPVMEYKYQETIDGKKYNLTEIIQPSNDDLYDKQVLKIKSKLTFIEVYNDKIVNKFISKFGNIRYIKNGKEYKNSFKIKDITPSGEKEYTYLEISSDVALADEIYLDIIIRTEKYTYKLK